MSSFSLYMGIDEKANVLERWLEREFMQRKLNSPFGYVLLLSCALGLSYVFATYGIIAAVLGAVLIIGAPVALGSMFNLQFGVILITVISYFVLGIKRYAEQIPMGLAMDVLSALMLMGLSRSGNLPVSAVP